MTPATANVRVAIRVRTDGSSAIGCPAAATAARAGDWLSITIGPNVPVARPTTLPVPSTARASASSVTSLRVTPAGARLSAVVSHVAEAMPPTTGTVAAGSTGMEVPPGPRRYRHSTSKRLPTGTGPKVVLAAMGTVPRASAKLGEAIVTATVAAVVTCTIRACASAPPTFTATKPVAPGVAPFTCAMAAPFALVVPVAGPTSARSPRTSTVYATPAAGRLAASRIVKPTEAGMPAMIDASPTSGEVTAIAPGLSAMVAPFAWRNTESVRVRTAVSRLAARSVAKVTGAVVALLVAVKPGAARKVTRATRK